MKIAAIELIELQNIPVTPPVFKKPLRTGVRVVKVKTDNGLVGALATWRFMHSAGAAFLREELAPWVT
jgi:hypothetical protein